MKIGLVTYHRSSSYGACLQAYATQRALCEIGHSVSVIDYVNDYEQRIKKIFFSADGTIKSMAINAIKSIVFGRNRLLNKAFGGFAKEYNLTEKQYHNLAELNELTFDIMAVGSDQVWNSQISGKLDPVFMLDFGKARSRISISSSFGSYELNEQEKKIFSAALSRFSNISVRERFGKEQLKKCGFDNVSVICDPTMFLEGDVWKSFSTSIPEHGYILTYFVSGGFGDFSKTISSFKNQFRKPVYNIQSSRFPWKGVDRKIVGVTPQQFLGYLQNADIVITDSFHGTVFSLLFHKQLIVINNKANPIRIRELLKSVGLEDIEYNISKKVVNLDEKEYKKVDVAIEKLRQESIRWLKEATSL